MKDKRKDIFLAIVNKNLTKKDPFITLEISKNYNDEIQKRLIESKNKDLKVHVYYYESLMTNIREFTSFKMSKTFI